MKVIKISKWIIPQFLVFFLLDLENKLLWAFLFIVLHEFSHYLVAKKLGSNIINFKVHPLGATLEIEDYEGLGINDEILICLAGPFFNIITAIVSLGIMLFYGQENIFRSIFEVNFVLGFMNLIPAYPLDGAKVLRAILSKFYMYKKAHKIGIIISFIISVMIAMIGAMLVFINIMSINLFIIGVFMVYTTYTTKERTMYIVLDQIISKAKRFNETRYIENRDVSVYYEEDFITLLSMIERDKFNTFYVLNEKMEFLYELREDEIVELLKEEGNMRLDEYYKRVIK
ncbi:MAG: site-2 protease family protein [Sarcina sp.]